MADKVRLSIEKGIKTVLFFTATRSAVGHTEMVSCPFLNMMGAFIQNSS
jgi:hypothetical protein